MYTGDTTGGSDRDPDNLSGNFTAHVRLFNAATFDGTTQGTFEIRDPVTNKKKFHGHFLGATQVTGSRDSSPGT